MPNSLNLVVTKPKILIVDDSSDNLQVLLQILKDDYAIVAATTGTKALKMAMRQPVPDLIILDIVMPNMNGYDVCKQLKANPSTKHIPVIFITGLDEASCEADGFALGAVDYMTKPLNPAVVKARIDNHLSLRQQNKHLQDQNAKLLRNSRLKNEFLAKISYELRTPLHIILGISEVLQEELLGTLKKEQSKAIANVNESVFHLLELMNDILELSTINFGQTELELAPVEVTSICDDSLVFVREQTYHKKIQLSTQFGEDLPHIILDKRLVQQALINLLNNAVSHTPEGGKISINVHKVREQKSSSTTKEWLRISVTNTGLGLSKKATQQLSQALNQVDNSFDLEQVVIGLGLALVKRVLDLHGGYLTLSSEIGVGSCFAITLPYVTPTSRPRMTAKPSVTQSHRVIAQSDPSPQILVVEDNEIEQETITTYLQAKGYHVIAVGNGNMAIEQMKLHRPNLILMDIQMPVKDGLDTMRTIRLQEDGEPIPIIALTGLAMPGDRDRCLDAGATDYISKPTPLKELHSKIQSLLETSAIQVS